MEIYIPFVGALLGLLIAGLAFITPAIIMQRQASTAEDECSANPFPLEEAEDGELVEGQPVLLTAKPGRDCSHRVPREATYLADRDDRPGWAYFRSGSGQRFSARSSDILRAA